MNYEIHLENFDGPMDLLLHFVKETKLDIYEIQMSSIIENYLNYINSLKNLNIDIYLPMNTEGINVWGHGPYNGKCKIISNSHANFKVKNVKPGQYVAARVLFDNYNIQNATKISNIYAKQMIYQDENTIIENKKETIEEEEIWHNFGADDLQKRPISWYITLMHLSLLTASFIVRISKAARHM